MNSLIKTSQKKGLHLFFSLILCRIQTVTHHVTSTNQRKFKEKRCTNSILLYNLLVETKTVSRKDITYDALAFIWLSYCFGLTY